METLNFVVGVVLFVVVLIVLVANTQRVSDLKKSIKTAATVSAPSTGSHGIVVRDANGNYAPKHPYYVRLIRTSASSVERALPAAPTESGVVDRILIRFDRGQDYDGWKLADDYEKKRCVVFYRPERRILYTVLSAHVLVDDGSAWEQIAPGAAGPGVINTSTAGMLLLNLKKNSGRGTDKMFADVEIPTEDTASGGSTSTSTSTTSVVRRTIIGVPGAMSGNSVSGV